MAFESIPTILTPQELLDKAFGRAAKIEAADKDRGHRHRKTLIQQLELIRDALDDSLGKWVTRFPSLDQVAPYHRALVELLIGEDDYRMNLGAVQRARVNIVTLLNKTLKEVNRETDVGILGEVKRRTYGRVASIIDALDRPLKRLASFRDTLRRLPNIEAGQFTVVIAGYPNVGKSSLIRVLTNAEPEVASYPFTTKSANVGHVVIKRKGVRWHESVVSLQFIDTPGLLDRPEAERNAIEHQATLALRHLADAVLFLRDPTGHCGFPVDVQEHLLDEVRDIAPAAPLLIVETKSDFDTQSRVDTRSLGLAHADHTISTVTGTGVQELVDAIVGLATKKPKDPELEAYLRGDDLTTRS